MKVDLQRFQDVKNKSHLDLAHILCASFSLKSEEVIRHLLERKEELREERVAAALRAQFQTPKSKDKFDFALKLIKEVRYDNDDIKYRKFLNFYQNQFFEAAIKAVDLENVKYLIEDLRLDVNSVKSTNKDNILHRTIIMQNSKELRAIFNLVISKATKETINQPNQNKLTPLHFANIFQFRYAKKALESKIAKVDLPGLIIKDEFVPYSEFTKKVLVRDPQEANRSLDIIEASTAFVESYRALHMNDEDQEKIEENILNAEESIKGFIPEIEALSEIHKAKMELNRIKSMENGPAKLQLLYKVKMLQATINELSSAANLERQIVELLIRFYTLHEEIDHDLIAYFENELTKIGLYDSLVFVYHHAFLIIKENTDLAKQSSDDGDLADKIKENEEKSKEYLQKAKQIIEQDNTEIVDKVAADNYYYFSLMSDSEESKFELLKKGYEKDSTNVDISLALCALSLVHDPQNTLKYLLSHFGEHFAKENLDEMTNSKSKLSKIFELHPAFKIFNPILIFAQFQIALLANEKEEADKLFYSLNANLNQMVLRNEKQSKIIASLFHKFIVSNAIKMQISRSINDGDYYKARSYSEYLQDKDERDMYSSLLNKIIESENAGDEIITAEILAADLEASKSVKPDLPPRISGSEPSQEIILSSITNTIRSIVELKTDAISPDFELPCNIDFLAHNIESGLVDISKLSPQLARIYFKYKEITNSTMPLDVSKAKMFLWEDHTADDVLAYNYHSMFENIFPLNNNPNVFVYIPYTEGFRHNIVDIKSKMTNVNFQQNCFTYNIPEMDEILFGNKIIMNKRGLKLLIFDKTCKESELETELPKHETTIKSQIVGKNSVLERGIKVTNLDLDQFGIKDISECREMLDLQMHYDNYRSFVTSNNSSDEHNTMSQSPLEFGYENAAGDPNLSKDERDTTGDIKPHFQEVSEC